MKSHGRRTMTTAPAAAQPNDRLESLRKMLLEQRKTTLQEIEELLGDRRSCETRELAQSVLDEGDQALMNAERERDLSLMEMRNRSRQMIDAALARLDEGTYGRCEDCDKEISEKRLQAVPFARRCLTC